MASSSGEKAIANNLVSEGDKGPPPVKDNTQAKIPNKRRCPNESKDRSQQGLPEANEVLEMYVSPKDLGPGRRLPARWLHKSHNVLSTVRTEDCDTLEAHLRKVHKDLPCFQPFAGGLESLQGLFLSTGGVGTPSSHSSSFKTKRTCRRSSRSSIPPAHLPHESPMRDTVTSAKSARLCVRPLGGARDSTGRCRHERCLVPQAFFPIVPVWRESCAASSPLETLEARCSPFSCA
jgi:hypothetical protein